MCNIKKEFLYIGLVYCVNRNWLIRIFLFSFLGRLVFLSKLLNIDKIYRRMKLEVDW